MLLLNVIKVFLLQAFFVSYVYASFVATKAIYYNETMSYMCLSLTWLPFDVQVPNCEKDSNPFGGERIDFWVTFIV
uniref:Secreted protein n=1 Tax=Panagrolaimus davidi TaxID=227884 RepID=A0A914PWX9_9BILA